MPDAFRILLVDDSETVTEMLSWLFGSAGYTVETAADGVKGLRSAFLRVPDLVVMATRMPRLDGIQACRLLKADPATRDVPVILLTSEEAGADRLHAARAGADRCLIRDASPEDALPAVRECLAGKAPRPEGGAVPGASPQDDIEILSRVNGLLEATLFEATLSNEVARVGREVDDFESTARVLFRLIREIAPAEAMGAVFTDGVYSEGVSVVPDGSGDPFRAEVREMTERLRGEAGVPFAPDRVSWTGIQGGFRGSGGVVPGSLAPRAVCTVRAGEMAKGLLVIYSGTEGAGPAGGILKDTLLRQVFMALENAWLYRQIARISVTDGLTGLTNVRHFREQMQREHTRACRHNDPYTILMMDIDHFKKINDLYGHPVGDTVLREMAAILREAVRITDLPARYGGEEFIVFLSRTRLPEAAIVGDRLREAVERRLFAAPSPMIRCTVSVGIADYLPGTEGTENVVIERADQALYAAKRGGRNRVVSKPAKEA
ncbi:MAG TPA: diguanylate cyclase [Candidatus Methylomirabilis sp.]|nr:diguanylate cyclase [Candidatus Methylomirabilis sp.]